MIEIIPGIHIGDTELEFEFTQSSGPGGQNINKVATAARLRFDVLNSPSLPDELKMRLMRLAGSRMTDDGVLVIEARRFRTQEQNRADAMVRLAELIRQAARPPIPRRPTRPTRASQVKRVESKRKRGAIKKDRRVVSGEEA